MKIKNILAVFVFMCAVFSYDVYASEEIEFSAMWNSESNNISIKGKSPATWGRRKITILVMDPVENGSEVFELTSDTTEEEFLANVHSIKEVMCDEEGNFEDTIKFRSDDINGYISVKIAASGIDYTKTLCRNVKIIGKEQIKTAVENIKKVKTADELIDIFNNTDYAEILNIDINNDIYKRYPEKVCEVFIMLGTNHMNDKESIYKLFNNAVLFTDIFEAENMSDKIEEYAYLTGFDVSNQDYTDNKEDICRLSSMKENTETLSDYGNETGKYFECMTAIATLNNSNRDTAMTVLKKYSDVLGTDISLSEKIDEYEISKALVGINFKTKKEIQNTYSKRIDELKNKKPPEKESGSRGGGGGFSGGIIINDDPVKPEKNNSPVFEDVPFLHWANKAVTYLAGRNVINGIDNIHFIPDGKIKREEAAKILCNAFKLKNHGKRFSDVAEGVWYEKHIYNAGDIIKGYPDGSFGAGKTILRQDFIVMICRVIESKGIELTSGNINFSDKDEISDYASDAVSKLCSAGIIKGSDNKFSPKSLCTRAEACEIVYEVINYMEKEIR